MEGLIYSSNPWWEWRHWEERDRELKSYNAAKVKWRPDWIDGISLKPFSMNFVLGPRQVGKTTGVKLLISELLSNREPESVFYFSCDLATDVRELRGVLDFYRGLKQGCGVKSSIIVLDEVTSVEEWWKVVKGYVDLGFFDDDVLILMGSASFRIKAFSEAFPGRRGSGVNVEVLPLSFPEYVRVYGVEWKRSESGKLTAIFDKYLETGGFPRSMNGDERFPEDLIASAERDVVKASRNPKLLRMVAREIISKTPSALSYNAIAGELGVSHNTVQDYVKLMEDMFIVAVAYMRDRDRVFYRREKKIFFRDPFYARAFASLLGAEIPRTALLEWVVQEHLFRKFGEVFFYRDGYEIDVIAGDLKIEVKTGRLHRRYPKGVLVLSEEELPFFLVEETLKTPPK
ncbi:MAG: ATP-binding protein [Thermofilaceae archaeon]|nr:ATP-binding protein [Thermofilaceae archaeon]